MEIRPVGGQLFHADWRTETDMTKLVVAFRSFADAPSNVSNKSCKFQYGEYVCHVPIFYTIRAYWG
jgi:hypothetical protein